MKKINSLFACLLLISLPTFAKQRMVNFEHDGNVLNGVLNTPECDKSQGIILLVHGSGRTDAVEGNWYLDVRSAFVEAGYTTYIWDKPGCGNSEGEFNYNQTIESSASEVIAAINKLTESKVSGYKVVGLWGISRAGWINPVVINSYKEIDFWISVSGVDDKESFGYLYEKNLEIKGCPSDSIELLTEEWKSGNRIMHSGGSYEDYLTATQNLRKDEFIVRFNGGFKLTENSYYKYRETFSKTKWDENEELQIYVENFDQILSNVDCPVLALFGEKDMHVNWRNTSRLYTDLLKSEDLTIESFKGCNHNMFKCETGGFYEFEDNNLSWDRCEGYIQSMTEWLSKIH